MGWWKRFWRWLKGDPAPSGRAAARQRASLSSGRAGPGGAAAGKRKPIATNSPEADVKLAERYLMMRMEDSALHYCMEALEKDPEHLLGKVTLARVFLAKGMREQALAALEGLDQGPGGDVVVRAVLDEISGAADVAAAPEASHQPGRGADAASRELASLEAFRASIEAVRGA